MYILVGVLCMLIGVYMQSIRQGMLYFVTFIFYGACIKICCGAVGLEAHPPHHTPRSRAAALLFLRGDPSTNHHSLSNTSSI